MNRPGCVVNVWQMPRERRPKSTPTPGVAAEVASPGDATGLTHIGVHLRVIQPGDAGTNRHFHDVEEEWAYVLSGTGHVSISQSRLPVRAGSFVGFPPGPRPHHFVCEGPDPLILLEGGERRPDEDTFWYPDLRRMARARKFLDEYSAPAEEPAGAQQCLLLADVAQQHFQHDVDPQARRTMRSLATPNGLHCQRVHHARVAAGDHTTAYHTHDRTDEGLLILEGAARVRVGADRFAAGPGDFLGHPAGSAAHMMQAETELVYLLGGEHDPADIVTYPEAGLRREYGSLRPL